VHALVMAKGFLSSRHEPKEPYGTWNKEPYIPWQSRAPWTGYVSSDKAQHLCSGRSLELACTGG